MLKKWRIPAIILVLLILAILFRWNTLGIRTYDSFIYKYKIDRWNGAVYKEGITVWGYEKELESPSIIPSEVLTICWDVITGVNIIWLLYAVSNIKKKDSKNLEVGE